MNSTIYINKQGSCIKQSGKRVIVSYEDQELLEIPTAYIDKIMIFGNVQVSSQTIGLLLNQGIHLSYLTYDGRIKGNLVSANSKNITLRLKQYEYFRDEKVKLELSRIIVAGKLSNQLQLITKYSYIYPDINFEKEVIAINKVIKKSAKAKEKAELLGFEGSGSHMYFSALKKILRNKAFEFSGRKSFPSPDPVNAMLSLGYVLVTNEIMSLLEAFCLDPYLGFLHDVKYGRESLALDLVEEFRQPLVDAFIIKIVNRKEFSPEDFEKKENGGSYFKEAPCKEFFRKYEENINQKVGDDKSWRDIIRQQVEKFEDFIANGKTYEPFLL